LRDADRPQVVAEDGLKDRQKIGVERRLIKDFMAQPIARDDFLRPLVVAARVARQMIKQRYRLDLKEAGESERKSEQKNGEAGGRVAPQPWDESRQPAWVEPVRIRRTP